MTIKKEYKIGDDVWIHGITPSNKLTKGKIIADIDLSSQGHAHTQYIIEIPTHIEPLLEIRTWHSISQDEKGPVGSLRDLKDKIHSDSKKIRQLGITLDLNESEDDPTPDQIMAALEKSTDGLTHKPLHIKENRPRKKYYPRKKNRE